MNRAAPSGSGAALPGAAGRVGPNAVSRLGEALREGHGGSLARDVYAAAGLPRLLDAPPEEMVDERLVAELFRALYCRLPRAQADLVARDAGARTAGYLLAHRIPGPVRTVLRRLPARLSARLLLRAISANAWTFAGSGDFRARAGPPHRLEIEDNPIAIPGCAWHAAVFEGLFRALVTPRARTAHTRCCLEGSPVCRFEIRHDGPRPHAGARRAAAAPRVLP